jgi:hypothetical protein
VSFRLIFPLLSLKFSLRLYTFRPIVKEDTYRLYFDEDRKNGNNVPLKPAGYDGNKGDGNKRASQETKCVEKSMGMSFFVACPWPRPGMYGFGLELLTLWSLQTMIIFMYSRARAGL